MSALSTLEQDFLAECADDHVGLWSVIRCVEEEMPSADTQAIHAATLSLLEKLLGKGQIQAGFPDSDGRHFHVWPLSARGVVEHIASIWKPRGPRPTIGEIVWFTAPSELSVPRRLRVESSEESTPVS